MNKVRSFLLLAGLVALSAAAVSAQPLIFSKTGSARVGGRPVFVHVTVGVPAGENADRVADAAIRAQGGIPFTSSEFTTTGLVWDQFSDANPGNDQVVQRYNPKNDPTPNGRQIFLTTQAVWTSVTTSSFAFADGGDTNKCPSLVRECPGRQSFDGANDVAWVPLNDPFTLAVTWSSSEIDEADIAMNTNQNWAYYDAESVLLHENGHALGLGHTNVSEAVMVAIYAGVRRQLADDDIAGVSSLYPVTDPGSGSFCGNGVVDSGEDCDPAAPLNLTCSDLDPNSIGNILCTNNCELDVSGCVVPTSCTLLTIGESCTADFQCCSGKCRGKRGEQVCR